MTKATIVADKLRYNVTEGNFAVSTFNFVNNGSAQALDNDAQVVVRLQGIGATKGKDYVGFEYNNGFGWTSVPANGAVPLKQGTTSLQLRTEVKTDAIAGEQNESLLFSVAQTNLGATSKVLENSYYVTSTANIKEPAGSYFSKITVDTSVSAPVTEGTAAVGAFKLSKPLSGEAVITAQVEGHGATLNQDTTGALSYTTFANGTATGSGIVINGRVTLPAGTDRFELSIATVNDKITESVEQLNFKVGQVRGNLKDSYYVNALVDVEDQGVRTVTFNSANAESKNGDNNRQDVFDMVNADSKPFDFDGTPANPAGNANGLNFDTINRFGTGDVIKLSDSVQRYSIGTVDFEEFTGEAVTPVTGNAAAKALANAANAAALLDTLNNDPGTYDGNFRNGTGSILKIVESDTVVWLLIDTNANGIMDTRQRNGIGDGKAGGLDNQYDTLIKVVGSVNSFGETLAEQITGESFITE